MGEDVIIRAEGLGKKYVIGHQAERERYQSLRDVMARNARNLARSARDLMRGRALVGGDEVEEFWALRDLDFEIRRGDVVGIIGRNGAGKSTLLKILSRITEPSEGRVEIRGRVASLLEVGTGFHPELTGRENIFLNGAILGMSRAEIRRKFDEIVAFAEVEKFLDTPVKRYSSGMYVRLAFAVAAHLEPEILVVDEVLAVGDAEFQRKCLGKMQDVASHGRTVLFVSHQLGMVSRLCSRSLLLRQGRLIQSGPTGEVLEAYQAEATSTQASAIALRAGGGPQIAEVATQTKEGEASAEFPFTDPIQVRVDVAGRINDPGMLLSVTLVSRKGDYVSTAIADLRDVARSGQDACSVTMTFPGGVIAPNSYYFRVALYVPPASVPDLIEMICPISIRDTGTAMAPFEGVDYGHVLLDVPTRIQFKNGEVSSALPDETVLSSSDQHSS